MTDAAATIRLWHSDATVPLADRPLAIVRDGAVAHIVINRPEKRNALTGEAWRRLRSVMEELAGDAGVKLIALRGAGARAFSAGADIEEFPRVYRDQESARAYSAEVRAALLAVERSRKPTLAVIYGACVGGGCGLAMACDLSFAADDARFAIPPSKLGSAYSAPETRRLVALVGVARAKDILFSGRLIPAVEARAIGLVGELAPAAELEARAAAYAKLVLANSGQAIGAAKILVNAVAGLDERPAGELDRIFAESFAGTDFREGYTAFIEKRPPRFT